MAKFCVMYILRYAGVSCETLILGFCTRRCHTARFLFWCKWRNTDQSNKSTCVIDAAFSFLSAFVKIRCPSFSPRWVLIRWVLAVYLTEVVRPLSLTVDAWLDAIVLSLICCSCAVSSLVAGVRCSSNRIHCSSCELSASWTAHLLYVVLLATLEQPMLGFWRLGFPRRL